MAPEGIPGDWAEIYNAATEAERQVIAALAAAGTARPELGYESTGGIPIALSWPDWLLAADLALEDAHKADLAAEGWLVLPPGAELCAAARRG